ncbi:ABC transporter substrate-binding protein [Novosphingobium sp. PP1Y]|uniref:ABC transporter substrate-binding protein n=1 Tax=Novosphingobium sp. PP1Y TaxID=702113 RepID=UPI00020EF182|nr:ABC transporter substrate-binding protein [Novosphingobium sp. PP1Y]CCA94256.1 extracellular solute-binding protein [Novosphingobium sp. PP1Y]
MLPTRKAFRALAPLVALTLGACSGFDNSTLNVAVIGELSDPFQSGKDVTASGQLIRAATVEGLVAFDEKGRVIPALADRWIVTDDGQSYIFRLRDGDWASGDPISAESAKKALDTALKSLRRTTFALDLAGLDEVRVMAGRVIEIRLDRPMPYLLQLLAQPELGLYEDKQGNGPMRMKKIGDVARLTPIDPSTLGLPEIQNWDKRTRNIDLLSLSGPEAVQRFNDGKTDLVLGGRIEDFPLTRSVGILRGTIQLDPVVGLFGLQVMNDKGFLADPANREALAMAIDRDALIEQFRLGGWKPTTRIVTPSLDGDLGTIGERWSEQSLEERRAVAAARVRIWQASAKQDGDKEKKAGRAETGSGGGAAAGPQISIWLPQGEGSDILLEKLGNDFAAIGLRLEKAESDDTADLALVDDVARYPRAVWYLNHLSCRAKFGLCSQEADARVSEALAAATPEERAALMTEAEAELTAENVYIPFGSPIRWSLVRGSVDGFATNSWGWHPLMPLAWLPR